MLATESSARRALSMASIVGSIVMVAGVATGVSLASGRGHVHAAATAGVQVNTADAEAYCASQEKSVAEYGTITGVVESVVAPASDVEKWQETRNGDAATGITSPLRSQVGDDALVYVCDYSGEFVGPVAPGVAQYTVADLILVPGLSPMLDSEGHTDGYASLAKWLDPNEAP